MVVGTELQTLFGFNIEEGGDQPDWRNYCDTESHSKMISILHKVGGANFFDAVLYSKHGFSTVYNDLDWIRRMVSLTFRANLYKYEHLYETTIVDYTLSDPILRKTTETHSGSDTVGDAGSSSTTNSGTDTSTTTSSATTFDSTSLVTQSQNVNNMNHGHAVNSTASNNRTVGHGHVIETVHEYNREPQAEIQSERAVAMFSLQQQIIDDILDAIAIPVYINYAPCYESYR